MASPRILGMIMAGGRGKRLHPLTRHQVKPAVSFGSKYRVIDFVLSNFVNSGCFSLYILVQYRSQSLIEHLRTGWRSRGMIKDHFIAIVPPQMCEGAPRYRGTADALVQNVNLIRNYAPDIVAVFGADHVFRMDLRQMVDFHLNNRSDVTIAAMPVERMEATRFGVVDCELDGRVTALTEKPAAPSPIPGRPEMAFASMGNFLFRPAYLIELLHRAHEEGAPAVDLSGDVLPAEVNRARVFAYNFAHNTVPGERLQDASAYWRDIGALPSYFQSHMDLVADPPLLNLDNPLWPIRAARFNSPPTRLHRVDIHNALIGEGCDIEGARLKNVVLGRGVRIEPGAEISDSVIMDRVHIGKAASIQHAIIDHQVEIEEGEDINPDEYGHREDIHVVPEANMIVVPQPQLTIPYSTSMALVEEEYF